MSPSEVSTGTLPCSIAYSKSLLNEGQAFGPKMTIMIVKGRFHTTVWRATTEGLDCRLAASSLDVLQGQELALGTLIRPTYLAELNFAPRCCWPTLYIWNCMEGTSSLMMLSQFPAKRHVSYVVGSHAGIHSLSQ